MRVLITGRGTSGSWQIRGAQLGAAIGAAVVPDAKEVEGYDLAVLVKRPAAGLIDRLQRAGVPVIWDVVDAWPQPHGNEWSRAQCMAWLREQVRIIRPAGIVAATRAMAADCEEFGVPVLALPHHARPGLRRNPIRPVKVVGYEGGEHYLGRWRRVVERECAARGWRFVVNPPTLADLDIVLALRDSAGYAATLWKSNVKLANAQGSGTPVICNREAGYMETASDAERWVDSEAELSAAFDALTDMATRRATAEKLHVSAPRLDRIAMTYIEWLRSKF